MFRYYLNLMVQRYGDFARRTIAISWHFAYQTIGNVSPRTARECTVGWGCMVCVGCAWCVWGVGAYSVTFTPKVKVRDDG